MFLWIVFLALWGFLFNFYIGQSNPIKSLAVGVLSLIIVGFLLFLLLTSNPFQTILPVPPPNGADINPVLLIEPKLKLLLTVLVNSCGIIKDVL